jgi:SgrR family transcriptional regulator
MKLESHYIRLHESFPKQPANAALETTLDEIAALLDCTHRNAVLLLKRMSERSWLLWEPERGRGRRSRLTFLVDSEAIMIKLAQELVLKKDLRGALEQMNVSTVPAALKEHFHNWLNGHFGHSSELRNDKRVDTLRFPLMNPIASLDPIHINLAAESHLAGQLFDSLVRYNRLQRTIEPHIAHAWDVDAARTEWTFYLRKGVLFHHSRELTADDAVYSLLRLARTGQRLLYRWVYTGIASVEAIDPITIRIRLERPNELFLHALSVNRAAIVPRDECEELELRFGTAPIGTGPFRLTRHDSSITILEAFPSYFQGRAHLDRVELWHVQEPNPGVHGGQQESFQIIHNYRLPDEPPSTWSELQNQSATCKFITVNLLKTGPLADEAIRAVAHRILSPERVMASLDHWDTITMPPGFLIPAFADQPHEPYDAHHADPGESAEALKEQLRLAGYQGETIRLSTIPHYEQDAKLLQLVARSAGLKLEFTLLPMEQFKGEQRLAADLLLFSLPIDHDVELRLVDLYTTMQEHLGSGARKLIQHALDQVIGEPSPAIRSRLLLGIEQRLVELGLLQFLYRKRLKTIYHSSVKGISLDALDAVQFKNLWFRP